jgi:acyl-CoA synthetase (AMP-forming)/AMP-acid ligase II
LTRTELLYIYCMTLFSTLVPGHGAENVIIPVSVTARYFASPENKWEQLFHQYIPDWFAPTDPEVVRQFYEGLSPGASLPWSHWYVPMAVWGGVSLLLYVLVMCLSVLFRRQWADHEKLVFPLVALPLEMTSPANRPEGSFYGNKLMWVGFGVAVVVRKPGEALDPDHVLATLKARLANFKIPKRCFVVDELPRNTMGKVQKNLLREQHKHLFY